MDRELKNTIAEELKVPPEELTPERLLTDLELWDSVMVLSVMVILSEHLRVEIPPSDMAGLKTFGDIERLAARSRRS